MTSLAPKKTEPTGLSRRPTLSTEQKRQEPPAKSDSFAAVVRKAQRKELPGAPPQWPRVGDVVLQRTASENALLSKEADEGFGQRMRQAVLITEFTDVVDNARVEAYTSRHRLQRSSTYHA